MKSNYKHFLIALGIIIFTSCTNEQSADIQTVNDEVSSKFTRENGIYYIEVSGTPYECGIQHGEAMKEEIIKAVVDYKSNVAKTFGEDNAPKIIDYALNQSNFKNDIKEFVPDAWEEIRGIAKGSGISEDDALLLQMFEEVYEDAPEKVGLDLSKIFGNGCTAFAIKSNGKQYVGQNMDYSGNLQQKQLVIKYNTPEGQIICFSFVGSIGTNGVNSNGVSVYINTLPQGTKNKNGGLGTTFIVYHLMRQKNLETALAELKRLPRFGSSNYTLADFGDAVIAETSGNEMIVRTLDKELPILVGTNHMVKITERKDYPTLYENGEPVPGMTFLSLERKIICENSLKARKEDIQPADIQTILTTTPVNIYTPKFMTLVSSFTEYDGKTIRFHGSAGYDPLRVFNTYTFE